MATDISAFIGKIVEFGPNIEDMETYAEAKMRARITKIEPMYTDSPNVWEHVYKVHVDYSEFEEENAPFETSDYYDKDGRPRLTAREAGFYHVQDTIYMPSPEWEDAKMGCKGWINYFTVVPGQ